MILCGVVAASSADGRADVSVICLSTHAFHGTLRQAAAALDR
jgi:hypothetical protein